MCVVRGVMRCRGQHDGQVMEYITFIIIHNFNHNCVEKGVKGVSRCTYLHYAVHAWAHVVGMINAAVDGLTVPHQRHTHDCA